MALESTTTIITIEWFALTSAVVATYAAVLATYAVFILRKDRTRRLTINLSVGYLPVGADLGPEMLLFQVTNSGPRSITVKSPGILLPDGKQFVFSDPSSDVTFPHDMTEHTEFMVWMPIAYLSKQLVEVGYTGFVKIAGICQDDVGNTHKGKSIKVDAS